MCRGVLADGRTVTCCGDGLRDDVQVLMCERDQQTSARRRLLCVVAHLGGDLPLVPSTFTARDRSVPSQVRRPEDPPSDRKIAEARHCWKRCAGISESWDNHEN